MCTSTSVHYEQNIGLSQNGNESPGQGGGCGEWAQGHRYTMSRRSRWAETGTSVNPRP
jgi:hypothetical protein